MPLVGASLLSVCLQSAPAQPRPSAAAFFAGRLPLGLPAPLVPGDNPISEEKVQLGRRLFYDTRLSGNRSYSCSSCHQQARAFTDGRTQAVGSTGDSHTRNALSLTNVAYNVSYGWADTRATLEAQMQVPMYNEEPIELGLKNRDEEILARFAAPQDEASFRAAFPGEGRPVTMPHIVKAIASFERVLLSGNSPFDRYLYHDEKSAISPEALRGSALFFSSRLHCSECHSSFNLSGPVAFEGGRPQAAAFHDTSLYTRDLGLFIQTQRRRDMRQFRAPTLRNVAVTAPYMHDGSLATLRDVVEHYARGARPGTSSIDRLPGFQMVPSEMDDLLAFLRSLTDDQFLNNPAFGDPHIK